jgi:hypothetical protein
MRSSDAADPSLGPGLAYFVKSDEYLAHLSKYVDQEEVHFASGLKLSPSLTSSRLATVLGLLPFG